WRESMRSAVLTDAWTVEQLTVFFRLFANAVLEQHPSVLLGPEQTQAYAAHIVEAHFPEDATDVQTWLAPILRKVMDMGFSITHRPRLLPILREGHARRWTPSDLVEELVAALTPETVEIHANLELIKRFSLAMADGEKLIPLMRDGLFYELGIRYPRFRFVASDALPQGAFAFKIHAWLTMLRVGLTPDELLVNDTVEQLKLLKIQGKPAINPAN